MTKEERAQIATTILNQLGGRRFTVMTGAKNLMALDSGLSFKLPGSMTKNRINHVSIELDPSDTYTVKFNKLTVRKYEHKLQPISEFEGVYCDNLKDLFESETGLYTSL